VSRGVEVVLEAAGERLLADVADDDVGAFAGEGAGDRAPEMKLLSEGECCPAAGLGSSDWGETGSRSRTPRLRGE
jgi:hypothetical protein